MECSTVRSSVCFMMLIALWGLVCWPIWSASLTTTRYRVLDLLPFVVNCLGLLGNSYEGASLDWRLWSLNVISSGALSLASFLNFHQSFDPPGIAIIAIATAISLSGPVTRVKDHHIHEEFDRRIAIIKVSLVFIVCGLTIWGVLAWRGISAFSFLAQLLIGGSVALTSCTCLVFVSNRKKIGAGTSLLWLTVRIVLSAGIDCFWIWAIICLLSFSWINMLHNRVGLLGAVKNHWLAWQRTERFSASISVSLSLAILFLVLNGKTADIEVIPSPDVIALTNRVIASLNISFSCPPGIESVWKNMAISGYRDTVETLVSSELFPSHSIREHWMFEESASVAMVSLLLVSGIMGYLKRIRDPASTQGFWQPVFFFCTAATILIVSLRPSEILAYVSGNLRITWAEDSMMAISLGIFAFLFSFSVSAFRVKHEKIEREATPFRVVKATKVRVYTGIVIALMFIVAMLCLGQFFHIFPRQRSISVEVSMRADSVNGSNWEANRLGPFLSEDHLDILSIMGVNCSERALCISSLPSLSCNNTYYDGNLIDLVRDSGVGFITKFGLSDLLDKEILALGVLTFCTVILSFASLIFPVMDDLSLLVSGVSSAIMIVAVPYRIREMRLFEQSITEWFIPVLSVFQIAVSCASLLVRVDSPHRVEIAWSSKDEMMYDFANWPGDDLAEFVFAHTKIPVSGTAEEIYDCLLGYSGTIMRRETV